MARTFDFEMFANTVAANASDNDSLGDDTKIIRDLIEEEFCRVRLQNDYSAVLLRVKIDTPWDTDAIQRLL